MIAQALAGGMIWEAAKNPYEVSALAEKYPEDFENVLRNFPSYFTDVFRTMIAR